MKRISKPEGPMPKEYLTKSEPVEHQDEDKHVISQDNIHVPPKTLFDYNLKHLKSFKNIRRRYKMKNMKNVFLSDLKIVLDEYPPNDSINELNDELLVEIMNITEDYFFYPLDKQVREEVKREVVTELMLPYFRNDHKLLDKTIGHVYHKVKKSSIRKRMWQRLKYFILKK